MGPYFGPMRALEKSLYPDVDTDASELYSSSSSVTAFFFLPPFLVLLADGVFGKSVISGLQRKPSMIHVNQSVHPFIFTSLLILEDKAVLVNKFSHLKHVDKYCQLASFLFLFFMAGDIKDILAKICDSGLCTLNFQQKGFE